MAIFSRALSLPPSSSSISTLRNPSYSALSNPNVNSVSFSISQSQLRTLSFTSNPKSPIPPRSASSSSVAPVPFPTSIKSRLKNGETLYGIFLLSFSPTIAEIAGLAGYDFAVVDMEHGYGGISDALPCLHALAAANTAAILRLPESSTTWAKKALDLGPQGVMFPMVDSSKLARKAVSYCRYPPRGVRGAAHPIVRASGYGIEEGYLSNYEEELLIMCQVESEEAVEKAGEIVGVDGVDAVQMGPLDLSATMGYLWDPHHKKVREALQKAEAAVLKGGKFLSGFAMPHDGPDELRRRGYHMVSGTTDVGLFRAAAVEDVKRFKSLAEQDSDEEKEIPAEDKYWNMKELRIQKDNECVRLNQQWMSKLGGDLIDQYVEEASWSNAVELQRNVFGWVQSRQGCVKLRSTVEE